MEILLNQRADANVGRLPREAEHGGRSCIITVELAKAEGVGVEGGRPRYINRILLSGWVVCREPVEKILFESGGATLGVATYGIYRPDVGAVHGSYIDANHAGFTAVVANVPLNDEQSPVLDIIVVAKGGRRYGGKLSLQMANAAPHGLSDQRADAPSAATLAAFVDIAEIDSNNVLLVRGWAVAAAEVIAIQINAGQKKLGLATTGFDRSDVADNYSQYPNARSSGFEFSMQLGPERASTLRSIQVEVIARNGETKTLSADVARVKTREQVAAERGAVASASDGSSASVVAPAESSIRWSCDLAEITKRGNGYLSGWAVSPAGIRAISVSIGGRTVGAARLGLAREDVGAAIQEIAAAAASGYEIHFDLGQSIQDATSCVLRIEDNNGDALETTISLQIRDALTRDIDGAAEAKQSTPEDFRINLDSPSNREGIVAEPITGAVTVTGWALARQGLKSIAVYFGNTLVGQAKLGMRRPDIAALFPDWPDSLLSGFSLFVPTGMLKNGQQQLSLELTDKRGVVRKEHILVDVQKKAVGEDDAPLRRKVSAVETDTNLRIVNHAGVAPQFSLLVPVAGSATVREALPLTLKSISAQTYPEWRLFLLPTSLKDRKMLAELRAAIPADIADKVEILSAVEGGGIEGKVSGWGGATSTFLYIANLHPGDELAVDALLQVAISNVGEAAADFIYGDERRESPATHRVQMFLKPGWSPELLLSTNYIGRCWFASVNVVADCFTSLTEFAQASEYDRVLRLTERSRNVRRVPKVLSERHGEQFEAEKVEIQALQAAVKRRGIAATIEKGAVAGTYRFHRKLVASGKVSIIIPSIAARGLVKVCLESIKTKSTFKDYEIVLIDNIRDDSSEWKPWFRANADKVVEVWEDYNWSYFNNVGAYHATGEYLLFLNDDIEVIEPRWIESMMEIAQVEEVGVVGAYLLYPDRSVQHAGIFLSGPGAGRHAFRFAPEDDPGYFGFALTQRDMAGVTGACIMMRREVFDAVGGFNQAHSIINNDLDFCLRCYDAGLSTIYTPYARLIHHELASREKLPDTYDVEAFSEEWGEIFAKGDPFFHPGLSRSDDYYTVDGECLREVYAGYPIAHKSQIRRIVAFKLDHIGDFITALPALRRLKEHFPESMLAVVVGPAVTALAKTESAIDEVFDFAFFHARSGLGQKDISEDDLMALRVRLAPYQFDLAVDLRKHLDTRHVLQYSGAKLVAGFDQANKFPWLDFVLEWEGDPTWVNKRQHVAGDLLNLVDAIANGCKEDRNTLSTKAGQTKLPATVAKFSKTLYGRPVIGIHPASGNQLRQWPVEHFAGLIDLLVTRLPVHIAILGGPDELELANAVLTKVKQRQFVWSLVGAHKLSELPDVLQSLALFVGNNSGPKHVAAGLGVPTVAVHSAVVSTEEWGPLGPNAVALRRDVGCAPCYRAGLDDCHRNIACLREITPEDVYKTCLRFLALADKKNLNGVT